MFCSLVSPVLTILPALTPSLPAVLYLIDSALVYGPLPAFVLSFACPLFGSINLCDSSCLHLGLILSFDLKAASESVSVSSVGELC